VTRRLKVGFCDVHCYATTSQIARCIRCDRCYSTYTQQFLTVNRFLSNQIVATEDTTVRKGVLYPVRKICLRGWISTARSQLLIVSQLTASIRKGKRSKDRSETRHQRVRTHCNKEILMTTSGVVNKQV
jgi:hypothetical protein